MGRVREARCDRLTNHHVEFFIQNGRVREFGRIGFDLGGQQYLLIVARVGQDAYIGAR